MCNRKYFEEITHTQTDNNKMKEMDNSTNIGPNFLNDPGNSRSYSTFDPLLDY